MTKRPEPDDIVAMARIAGVPVDAETAQRVVRSIGPAFDGFAPVSGTLPFDLEPATFMKVQRESGAS